MCWAANSYFPSVRLWGCRNRTKIDEVVRIKSMASSLNTTDPAGRKPPSFGVREFLFGLFLAIIFLLLGHSMVRHRFFQGGRYHRNGSIGQ